MKKTIISLALVAMSAFGLSAQMQMPKMPENVAYSQTMPYSAQGRGYLEGQSYNFAATFFIYPDTKLDQAGAEALLSSLDVKEAQLYSNASFYVLNPVGDKYDAQKDFDAFVAMFDRVRSGNLKVVGIGAGATFVNQTLVPKAAGYIADILTIGGKPAKLAKDTPHDGVPAYVAGANAAKVSAEYITINDAVKSGDIFVNATEPLKKVVVNADAKLSLSEIFADAWTKVLSKNYRFNNYKHTHYEGCKFGEFGIYELEPYFDCESLGITRTPVEYKMGSDKPWLWYEYWPNELADAAKVAAHSVPVMVLLHGNTNDPRTQAETSGFIELAGEERFFVVEMEWQGSAAYGAMGHDGVESVILMLLSKYPQLDPSRVYAEGLSAGSMTATALGIKKSHIFTAVGGHSGGIMGGSRPGAYSSFDALYAEASQKRGAVEVPYCSVLGTADKVVPFITPERWQGNGYLNAWNAYQNMNGLPIVKDLDFSKDPLFGMTLQDRQTIVTNKGAGLTIETGQLYKGNMPLVKIVAVVDYGHWNFKPTARIMWDYFMQFSRDPETKKLIYHPAK